MNRIIEFRTWDNRWNNWVGIFEAKFLNNPEYSVQEFTGLYSVGKNKIFEGDIINTKPARYEVVFKDGMFVAKWLMGIGNISYVPLIDICSDSIIIGNIFENPDKLIDPIKQLISASKLKS